MKPDILYEDNHLIAVWKKAGELTQGDASGTPSLMDSVKDYIKKKYKKPGAVFLGLVHRLDRPVAGIVLYAKTSKGASRISAQFRERAVKKIYYALVEGRPRRSSATLVDYLAKEERGIVRRAKITTGEKGEKADLHYDTIRAYPHFTLLRIRLGTGKFHQIRAQLAHAGTPIAGDAKYGAKTRLPEGDIALAACELSFKTAVDGQGIHLTRPLPKEWESVAKDGEPANTKTSHNGSSRGKPQVQEKSSRERSSSA